MDGLSWNLSGLFRLLRRLNHHAGYGDASERRGGIRARLGLLRLRHDVDTWRYHLRSDDLWLREGVEYRTARIRNWTVVRHRDIRRRAFVLDVVVSHLRRRRELRLRLCERRRRRWLRCRRWARRDARGHHHHAIELRKVGDRDGPRRRHVSAHRPQQQVERLLFRNVRQLERHRTTGDPFDVDDFGLAHAGPFGEDLPDRRVLRDNGHATVLHRDLHFGKGGRSGQAEGGDETGQDVHLPHRRSEEHTSELQSLAYLVCRLLLEKKKNI